jgi:hypothetical protein
MSAKEANARIKINKLLEEAGWRFFGTLSGKAWTERLYQAEIDFLLGIGIIAASIREGRHVFNQRF